MQDAMRVLGRWESGGASLSGQRYRDMWRRLLEGDIDSLASCVCADNEMAATLRSMSPLGFLLSENERLRVRREAMQA